LRSKRGADEARFSQKQQIIIMGSAVHRCCLYLWRFTEVVLCVLILYVSGSVY